ARACSARPGAQARARAAAAAVCASPRASQGVGRLDFFEPLGQRERSVACGCGSRPAGGFARRRVRPRGRPARQRRPPPLPTRSQRGASHHFFCLWRKVATPLISACISTQAMSFVAERRRSGSTEPG
ncbi:unnamed protein product, partial [Prorocentrum cordatum]